MQDLSSQVDQWRIAAASVQGESHAKSGVGCEDCFKVGQTPNGYLVAIVSDGAGSAVHGCLAAKQICSYAEDMLADLSMRSFPTITEDVCRQGGVFQQSQFADLEAFVANKLNLARDGLLEHARNFGLDPSSYLATVVGVIAHAEVGVLIFHIGDGAVSIFSDNKMIVTSQPENGEYLNETYFLVEEWWKDHLRFFRSASLPIGSIFLMTDGVTELAYHREGRELAPAYGFFAPLDAFLSIRNSVDGEAALRKVLDTERARDLVDDDKTLVWIRRS